MFQGLGEDQLQSALEALLFVTDEPVSALRLSEILQIDITATNNALDALAQSLQEQNRGIQLREVAGGWRLYTHPAFHELLEEYVVSWDTRKLSPAMLETLAIVAYSQPCTRAHVAATRGVTSDSSVASLVSKGLLREAGTSDAPGNPTLYATTPEFLEKFGLRSVKDLPALEDFAPDASTKALIRERLSAHRITQAEIDGAQSGADGVQSGGDDVQAGDDGSQAGFDDARACEDDVLSTEDGAWVGVGNEVTDGGEAQVGEIGCAMNRTNVRDDDSTSSSSHSTFNQENESINNPLDDLMFEIEDEDEVLDVYVDDFRDDLMGDTQSDIQDDSPIDSLLHNESSNGAPDRDSQTTDSLADTQEGK